MRCAFGSPNVSSFPRKRTGMKRNVVTNATLYSDSCIPTSASFTGQIKTGIMSGKVVLLYNDFHAEVLPSLLHVRFCLCRHFGTGTGHRPTRSQTGNRPRNWLPETATTGRRQLASGTGNCRTLRLDCHCYTCDEKLWRATERSEHSTGNEVFAYFSRR